jgi:GT2 family glycosyltransferase
VTAPEDPVTARDIPADPEEQEEVVDDPGPAPPVVVAMVAHDPGDWFEDALRSLAGQDYPNLSVLVIDAGSQAELIARVATVLPSAYVRRVDENRGFATAANEVLEVVEGAAFYCFCHDDVALDPSAVRNLVEEALRSNAGVVGPKVVDWDEPDRLLDVGLAADKTGVVAPLVDRGELDQEQHDSIRDVFVVPSACVLVRSDLFKALGGFDTGIVLHGEDLDLCWRAQVAGARVVVVPEARARHRSRVEERRETESPDGVRPDEETVRLRTRHRIRTVLICYGRYHLLRVLPQALVFTLAEITLAVATGRFRQASILVSAWTWNLGSLDDIRARRKALRAVRRFPDSEVRRLQAHGSARLNRFVRGELGSAERVRDQLVGVGRGISQTFSSGSRQLVVGAWVLLAFVVLVGSRDLIAGRVPLDAGFAPISSGPFTLLRAYLRGWHTAGVGSEAPVPTAIALLGLGELPLLGARGLLQLLLVVGMIPVGAIGAWRLTRPLASMRARAVGLGLYVANPLPYDAIARGSWGGVLLYGAAPWLFARLLRAAGDEPFEKPADRMRAVAAYGIVLALLTAFVPIAGLLFVVVALAMVLVWPSRRSLGALGTAGAGVLVAALLHLPWTLDFVLPGADWWSAGGVSPLGADRVHVADLLRFQLGSFGVPALGWAVALAAVLPLIIGQEWRFRVAVRCWSVALVCWALAWTGSNGMLPFDAPPVDVVLAPAALALALSAALGMLAFEVDLRGYRFGYRQAASFATAVVAMLAVVPVFVASFDGGWESPRLDLGRTLRFLHDAPDDGGFRTLWLGDPAVLPIAGYRLADGLAYGFSDDGMPDVSDRIATSPSSGVELVADALHLVAEGRSDRLGRLLAPFGVRYIVLLSSSAPERANGVDRPLPPGLEEMASRQLDLRRIEVDPAVAVFQSAAWMPVRAIVRGAGAGAIDSGRLFDVAAATDFSGARPAEGAIGPGVVHLGVPYSSRWHLDGASHTKSLGWANAFRLDDRRTASFSYETSPARWLAVLAQVLLWAIALRLSRRRPRTPVEQS